MLASLMGAGTGIFVTALQPAQEARKTATAKTVLHM
jgi:hypothetical protein